MRTTPILATTFAGLTLLLLPAWASGAEQRASDSLTIRVVLDGNSSSGPVRCPDGTPEPNECFLYQGSGVVPGLGATTIQFTLVTKVPSPGCEIWSSPDVTVTVASRGRLDLVADSPTCQRGDAPNGSMGFAVKGGTGTYAGAQGDGTLAVNQIEGTTKVRLFWEGTITVPGLRFDTTPPALTGLTNRAVAATKARGRPVTYAVTAADAVDGPVPVVCVPRSGSFFKPGRTRVACTATDTSGNLARGSFTVTVGRPAHP